VRTGVMELEAEESTTLKAITRQQSVKTHQTLVHIDLLIIYISETVIIKLVAICKSTINPNINPNPVSVVNLIHDNILYKETY
jgi:hypothetical protein